MLVVAAVVTMCCYMILDKSMSEALNSSQPPWHWGTVEERRTLILPLTYLGVFFSSFKEFLSIRE